MNQRYMEQSELQATLKKIESRGVRTPSLKFSDSCPIYIKSIEDGSDIYSHEGVELVVPTGFVIDDCANIVPLDELVGEAVYIASVPPPSNNHSTAFPFFSELNYEGKFSGAYHP